MKKVGLITITLLSFVFLAACNGGSYNYRWLSSDGLPDSIKRTYTRKNVRIDYCLVKDSDQGDYYFEGKVLFKKGTQLGSVVSEKFTMALYDGDRIVKKIRLHTKGKDMSHELYLHKQFNYPSEFDGVGFGWNVRYMH